jgi:rod shape-determining protein MreC
MSERRIRWLFYALLAGQLVMLASRAPAATGGGTVLERIGLRILAPFGRAVDAGADGASAVASSWRSRSALLEENAALRAELEAQRLEIMRLRDLEEESGRLAAALDHARSTDDHFRLAEVVYLDNAIGGGAVVRSPGAPLRRNTPVVAPLGAVGRVVVVAEPYAKLQLLTDRLSSVGAMIERTRRQGIARGDGEGSLTLDSVPLQSEVLPGDRVVTAGIDGVFPPGIPIGVVLSVQPGSEIFHAIRVKPAVDFGSLTAVYLLDRASIPGDLTRREPS